MDTTNLSSSLALAALLIACTSGKVELDTGECADADADGWAEEVSGLDPSDCHVITWDCDGTNADINPGQPETCNGIDDDCDGDIDEDEGYLYGTDVYYYDGDRDGYGDDDVTSESCDPEGGFVSQSGDCDDTDSAINPDAQEDCDGVDNDCDGDIDQSGVNQYSENVLHVCPDEDGDSSGDQSNLECDYVCTSEDGWVPFVSATGDCDDTDPYIYPGAEELCDNADNNCDGEIDDGTEQVETYIDEDNDGYGDDIVYACDVFEGRSEKGGDCNDSDRTINPRASEVCNNVDDDCDGEIDGSSSGDAWTYYRDADGDTFGDASEPGSYCDDAVPSGYILDCDDCDDTNAAVNPDAEEICDGIDNDCNRKSDENNVCDTEEPTDTDEGDTGTEGSGDPDTGSTGDDTGDSETVFYTTDFGDAADTGSYTCSYAPFARSDAGSMASASYDDESGGCGVYIFGSGSASAPLISLDYALSSLVEDTTYTAELVVENLESSVMTVYADFGGGDIVSSSLSVGDTNTLSIPYTADASGTATLRTWTNYSTNYGAAVLDLKITY